jgi:hypothetical protein
MNKLIKSIPAYVQAKAHARTKVCMATLTEETGHGHADIMYGAIDLPTGAYAGRYRQYVYINNRWLTDASPNDQKLAMYHWFVGHYANPALCASPGEKSSSTVDLLTPEFSEHVSNIVINELASELEKNGVYLWVQRPLYSYDTHYAEIYSAQLDLEIEYWEKPVNLLNERMSQAIDILSLEGPSITKNFALNLVFGALISALEAFFWETADYWVANEEKALRDVVTKLQMFGDETRSLKQLFTFDIKNHVRDYLKNNIIWHQVNKVSQIFEKGLGIQLPSWDFFNAALDKRHHIVHRSGHDRDRNPVVVTKEEIEQLRIEIFQFANCIHEQLSKRDAL